MTITDPMFDEEDLSNPSYRCEHGTFIGNPYGADYMCFHCEMGTPWDEFVAGQIVAENRQIRRNTAYKWCEAIRFVPDPPMYLIKVFTGVFRSMMGAS